MKFRIDRLSPTVLSQPNFLLLKRTIGSFDSGKVTGFASLAETPFLKHLRLLFFGTGEYADTVLCGPAFTPLLLEIPIMSDQLREIADEFLKQVRQLDTTSESDPPQMRTTSPGNAGLPSGRRTLSA